MAGSSLGEQVAEDTATACGGNAPPSDTRSAREVDGKSKTRKSYAQSRPDTVALAKHLHRQGLSYRNISVVLAEHGHVTANRKPHVASAIQKMIHSGEPR